MLQSMGLHRVGRDLATEQQQPRTPKLIKRCGEKKKRPERAFLGFYLEKTFGQRKNILYVPVRCVEMQIMDT